MSQADIKHTIDVIDAIVYNIQAYKFFPAARMLDAQIKDKDLKKTISSFSKAVYAYNSKAVKIVHDKNNNFQSYRAEMINMDKYTSDIEKNYEIAFKLSKEIHYVLIKRLVKLKQLQRRSLREYISIAKR